MLGCPMEVTVKPDLDKPKKNYGWKITCLGFECENPKKEMWCKTLPNGDKKNVCKKTINWERKYNDGVGMKYHRNG